MTLRSHFLFKFLALVLCSAMLCLSVVAGVAVIALNEAGLYRKDFATAYAEHLEDHAAWYASNVMQRYAAMELGGANSQMADAYYGSYWSGNTFRWDKIGYRILDEKGNVLTAQELEQQERLVRSFRFPASGSYISIQSVAARQEVIPATLPPAEYVVVNQEHTIYDAVPSGGVVVDDMTISYRDSSQGVSVPGGMGEIRHDDEGHVVFTSWEPHLLDIGPSEVITGICFSSESLGLVYEASCASGVGQLYYDENNYVNFKSSLASPDVTAQEAAPTEPVMDMPAAGATDFADVDQSSILYQFPRLDSAQLGTLGEAEGTVAVYGPYDIDGSYWYQTDRGWIPAQPLDTNSVTDRQADAAPTEPVTEEKMEENPLHSFDYYDYETGMTMTAFYVDIPMPEYTVEVLLAEQPLRDEAVWVLLSLAYEAKDELLPMLGVSLVVMILCAVYLCCAAARTPGSEELRAGGLNRLPLDLYLLTAGALIAGAAALGYVAMVELMEGSLEAALSFAAAMLYAAAVLVVGFFFAVVAQLKTPGGFWWRNSAWVRLLDISVKLLKWLCRTLWRTCEGLTRWAEAKLWPRVTKLLRFLWGMVAAVWRWFWNTLKKIYHVLYEAFDRVYSLLPLIWQWLLGGAALAVLLMLAYASRSGFSVLLCLALGAVLIIYGARSFGVLLEAVRRMAAGELEEQVEEAGLIGSFRVFAKALNSLAGVAVVAAQKQLKSERMKTELITNVSHDIKTPLTSIINYVDLLQKPHTDQEQEVYLEVLSRQSQRLKKLIEDLMEMSKASTGNMSVDIRRVDAVEAVNQALGEFSDKLDKAQLIPVFRQPEQEIHMMADGRLVWRVLSNLLSNAVKYALPGTRMYLEVARVEDKVVISIKNISREELNVQADELLERFVRGDASRNTEGSGLGLNIAQSLMELQKGSLQLLVDGDLFKVTLIFPGA